MRWVRHMARMGETQNAYNLVGKPEGKIKLGKHILKWKHDTGRIMQGFGN
jgi:hypothetical protein